MLELVERRNRAKKTANLREKELLCGLLRVSFLEPQKGTNLPSVGRESNGTVLEQRWNHAGAAERWTRAASSTRLRELVRRCVLEQSVVSTLQTNRK